MGGFIMKIQVKRIGNTWKIIINDTEFISTEEMSSEEISQLIITLAKFEGITAEVDFTTKH